MTTTQELTLKLGRLAIQLQEGENTLLKQVTRWESDVASQAIADLEPYRKDAARYQWLRSRIPGSAYRVAGIIYSEGGEGVDAGIDSAMQTKEQAK